jgi:hypothetical protein
MRGVDAPAFGQLAQIVVERQRSAGIAATSPWLSRRPSELRALVLDRAGT